MLAAIIASHDRHRAMSARELAEEAAAARRHLANLAGRVSDADADGLQRVCHLIMELRHRADLPVIPLSLLVRSNPISAARAED
jgi:hypothetical protein